MSENLNTLRRHTSSGSDRTESKPPKRKFTLPSLAGILPWLLVAAFMLLLLWLFGDRFESGREVELVKVVTVRAQGNIPSGNTADAEEARRELSFDGPTLFQASGWIEPSPFTIRATALYSGVVDTVHVLEGERVQQGQLLATLVSEDAELDLKTAEAALRESKSSLQKYSSDADAARAALESLKLEIAAGQAHYDELKDQSDRLAKAGREVFRESEINQARLKTEEQRKRVAATAAREHELKSRLDAAFAAIEAAKAKMESAEVQVDRLRLALERTQVRSPVDGKVQKLFAAPGKKRMLDMDDPESATIATLYEPDELQARIDVPLEEVAQLAIGQPVRLRSSSLPDRVFEGLVTSIDGQADLQRNTLQAKVKILNPVDELRPEMLCRAEFLPLAGGPTRKVNAENSGRVALYVPESALLVSGNSASLWALDASGETAERRELRIGQDRRDDHVLVLEGLRPGDLVVNNPPGDMEAGERVFSR